MSGLREKKKQTTQKRILDAARDLLPVKGYTDVSVEEIAKKAEIGVGTFYNYFSSKAELFLSVMSEDLGPEKPEPAHDGKPESDMAEAVIAYLKKTFRSVRLFGKTMWRELFCAMFGSVKPNLFFERMLMNDLNFIDRLERFIDSVKREKSYPQSFQSHAAAYAVYSVIITQTMIYTYSETIDAAQFESNIESQIRFLFEGKLRKDGVCPGED